MSLLLILLLNFLLLVSGKVFKAKNDAGESKADVVLTVTKDENKHTETESVDLKPKQIKGTSSQSRLSNNQKSVQNKQSRLLKNLKPKQEDSIDPQIEKKFEQILEDNEKHALNKDHRLQQYVHHQQQSKVSDTGEGDSDDVEENLNKNKKLTIINKFNIIPPQQAYNPNAPPPEPIKVQKLEIEQESLPKRHEIKLSKPKSTPHPIVKKPKHKKSEKPKKVTSKSESDDEIVRLAFTEVDKVIHEILKGADKLYHELENNSGKRQESGPLDNDVYNDDSSAQNQFQYNNDYQDQNAFYDYEHPGSNPDNIYNTNYENPQSARLEGRPYKNEINDYDTFNKNDQYQSGSHHENKLDEALEEAAEVISNIKNLDEHVLQILQGQEHDLEIVDNKGTRVKKSNCEP